MAELEVQATAPAAGEEDDEDNRPIYNPKDVPLGWDGKPIPYWLYKLHGLNLRLKCEICGDETYRGPRAFQRHFQEWRHSWRMRQLGIPNTHHFQGVVSIDDARTCTPCGAARLAAVRARASSVGPRRVGFAVWAKLQQHKQQGAFKEDEVEFEDTRGNVINKKVYEDLRRQGLL